MPDVPVRPNNTKTSELRAEKRFTSWPCKKMDGSCLKNPKLTKLSEEKPFHRKREGGPWLIVANFLMSDHLFLRSGHNGVPVNLFK